MVKSIGVEPEAGSFACASATESPGVAKIGVNVGSFAPATAGSSVSTSLKFEPETVPWLETSSPPRYGLLTVTWNWMRTVLPANSVPTEWLTVSPDSGVTVGLTLTPRRGFLLCCASTALRFVTFAWCEKV